MSHVPLLAGTVTRIWRVPETEIAITLNHNTVLGDRSVYIDGIEVRGSVGSSGAFSGVTRIPFTLSNGRTGYVVIDVSLSGVMYRCFLSQSSGQANGNDVELMEENMMNRDLQHVAGERLRITVVSGDTAVDDTGATQVLYAINTVRIDDGAHTCVHRRFRDFHAMHSAIKTYLKGSPLENALPEPPVRGLKILEDHTSSAFIEKRRAALENYLKAMEQLYRVRANGDFLAFLGIVDEVREVSVRFPIGPMGITLSPNGPYTEITNLKPLPTGQPSPAQANGLIRIGYRVFRVNGEEMLTRDYATVVHKIQSSKRPMIIHFLGHIKEGNVNKSAQQSINAGEISFVPSVDEDSNVTSLSDALRSSNLSSPPPRTLSFSSFLTSLDGNSEKKSTETTDATTVESQAEDAAAQPIEDANAKVDNTSDDVPGEPKAEGTVTLVDSVASGNSVDLADSNTETNAPALILSSLIDVDVNN